MIRIAFLLAAFLAGAVTARSSEPAPTPAPVPAVPDVPRVAPADLYQRIGDDPQVVVLDVRTAAEFESGHVPGALHMPHDQVRERLAELEAFRDREVVLYCRSGRRSADAAQVLREAGFTRLRQLEGNYPAWEASKLPVEPRDAD